MLFPGRKTIGVFVSKMFKVFDEAFFAALDAFSSAASVFGPAMPSFDRPLSFWKASTASRVFASYFPLLVPV